MIWEIMKYIEGNLTKKAWEICPFKEKYSYDTVCKEKSKCRPSRPIPPTGTSVQVSTQDLVNHTVDRILLDKGIVDHVARLKEEYGSVQLEFIYKFGLDGSSGTV